MKLLPKTLMILLLLSFIATVLFAIGMETTTGELKHFFKESHGIAGGIFTLLALWHICNHRRVVKMLFFPPKRP